VALEVYGGSSMALVVAMMLACGEGAPPTSSEAMSEVVVGEEKGDRPGRRKRRNAPEDYGSDELLIPLLKFAADAQPSTIAGLRAGGVQGEYEVDPETFEWSGPAVRDGRLRFQQRGLRRATLNVQGRHGCDRLIEALSNLHGEPQEARCAERIWQTPLLGIRYVERPHQAACSVLMLVDGAFPPLEEHAGALDTSGVLDVNLGGPLSDFPEFEPTQKRRQTFEGPFRTEVLSGVATYAPTWTFFDGHLEEVTVRANEADCTSLRSALVTRYGPGLEAASPDDLNWVGCEVALEYRYSPALVACRVTGRSLPHFFQRVALETVKEATGLPEDRAALREHVRREGDQYTLGTGLVDWLSADPARQVAPSSRKVLAESSEQAGGVRLATVVQGGLVHRLGFQERDLLLTINGVPAAEHVPESGVNEWTVAYRRAGEDRAVVLVFEEGVLDEVVDLWGTFP
jgi:hypothetical protein